MCGHVFLHRVGNTCHAYNFKKKHSYSLGETATHASVFAQLIIPNGSNYGLHNFLVPIRDTTTLKPFPGVVIGDMGAKIGLNGIDNGFLMFDHYRVSGKKVKCHSLLYPKCFQPIPSRGSISTWEIIDESFLKWDENSCY